MRAAKLHSAIEGDLVRQPPRMHLGGSEIGTTCTRQVWYSFRWAKFKAWAPRMLRLFARGERAEKDLFIPILESIGCTVLSIDRFTGKQFLISDLQGHFGGSLDGIVYGVPDMPNVWMLLEFKTHKNTSFNSVQKHGVKHAHPKHFGQMQTYMHHRQLKFALYCAVCKNTDHLYFEIVMYDEDYAKLGMVRAEVAVYNPTPPPRADNRAESWTCKHCDYRMQCHFNASVDKSCRTCQHIEMLPEGKWKCGKHGHDLDKLKTIEACDDYTTHTTFSLDPKPFGKNKPAV